MEKIKHTKNELKKQKDSLKRFTRYLPTLALKKKQLQTEIIRITHNIEQTEARIASHVSEVSKWSGVFAQGPDIGPLIKISKILLEDENIAGIDIPVFKDASFEIKEYDLLRTPLWVDYAIQAVKTLAALNIQKKIFEKQLAIIREELRITSQRVNLFEKVMIPQAIENIRRIRIFLGDLQIAAVVTGKIAKVKIQNKERSAAQS